MIQDIAPYKLNNQFDAEAKPLAEDSVISFKERQLLVRAEGEIEFPKVKDFDKEIPLTYLFSVDNERFFLADETKSVDIFGDRMASDEGNVEGEFAYIELMALRSMKKGPKHRIFAAFTARHLADWYRDNKFCGRCGHKSEHSRTERAMKCPKCGYTCYPRIMPAVIVGVLDPATERILVTRYRVGYRHNALIAGFTEIGETMEETVAREVMEECGVRVKNIRYYKSQPWGIANDMLIGYFCDLDGNGDIRMDEGELGYAKWLSREELQLQPDNFSLTNEMMMQFKLGKV